METGAEDKAVRLEVGDKEVLISKYNHSVDLIAVGHLEATTEAKSIAIITETCLNKLFLYVSSCI